MLTTEGMLEAMIDLLANHLTDVQTKKEIFVLVYYVAEGCSEPLRPEFFKTAKFLSFFMDALSNYSFHDPYTIQVCLSYLSLCHSLPHSAE